MNDFTVEIRARGWTARALADRWGITPRAMSRICQKPKQIHRDALNGLPKPETGKESADEKP